MMYNVNHKTRDLVLPLVVHNCVQSNQQDRGWYCHWQNTATNTVMHEVSVACIPLSVGLSVGAGRPPLAAIYLTFLTSAMNLAYAVEKTKGRFPRHILGNFSMCGEDR